MSGILIMQVLYYPNCLGIDIVQRGTICQGKPHYRCRETLWAGRMFLLDFAYYGQSPEVKRQVVIIAMNSSSICDTARVLHVSTHTVMYGKNRRCPTSNR
jgi:transposase-like protein